MRNILRIIGYGILTWLIPFLVSIPFYSREGDILIDQNFFKSIMIVTGSIIGAFLIIRYFKTLTNRFVRAGYTLGLTWLLINWALDIVILIPLGGYDLQTYFYQIGLRYLIIPVMTIMVGIVADQVSKNVNVS
ncbi:MAG: hypothetical protein CVV33_06960 [Methanomicrobiales archaeon HGW-Methanomicrobiales-4]|nr:MAG: hypothetical protein CVV33_06960 [Methanomicrobiales archaeon HGW-Methanomicrobiales-4]